MFSQRGFKTLYKKNKSNKNNVVEIKEETTAKTETYAFQHPRINTIAVIEHKTFIKIPGRQGKNYRVQRGKLQNFQRREHSYNSLLKKKKKAYPSSKL